MEYVVVKIENTYVTFAHIKKSGGIIRVVKDKRFDLPSSLCGSEALTQPELLAYTIVSELQSGAFPAIPLAVYLGEGTELFAEYRYSETLAEATRNQRRQQAEDALLASASAPVYRVKYYTYSGKEGGLAASMVLAVDADFCDRLVASLSKDGYAPAFVSSSLIAFAETAKPVAKNSDRVLVVRAEKQDSMVALFADGRLARLARFSQGTETKNPEEHLLPYITEDTHVITCGSESNNALLRRRLKKAGVAAIVSVSSDMIIPHEKISLPGERLPEAFASAAFPGDEGESAYFAKERDVKRIGLRFRIALIVTLVAVLFACAIPPVTLYLAERDKNENLSRLEEPFYADAAAKLDQYRSLISVYTELIEAEGTLPPRDPSHADLLEEVLFGLLTDTQIEEMYYEKGKGILIDFTTKNVEAFDMRKDVAGRNGNMFLYESKTREEIEEDEGEWHIQIRVTLSPSAMEAP